MGLAAEVAFWSVLSFFPLLIATSATLGWLELFGAEEAAESAQNGMIDAFQDILTNDAHDMVSDLDRLTENTSPGLLTASALGALWTSSRGFAAIVRALDVAYNLEEKRTFIHTRAIAVGMSLGSVLVGAVMLALVVVGPLLGTGDELANHFGLGDVFTFLWDWVRWPVLLTGTVLWATTVLHVAPNHTTPWRWDIPGAVLTTILWGLFSVGLRFYLAVAGDSNEIMGILGGSLIALIWLFLLAIGLLIGGELNASLVQLGIAPPDRAALKDRQAAKKAATAQIVELTDQEVPSESVKPS
jgi:membrane protein